ncbi:hypothetical protein CAPTEDRAFT_99036, partial [Capitella teleta]
AGLCTAYDPTRALCATDHFYLEVPFTACNFVKRNVFSFAGPSLFNVLPCSVRSSSSLAIFKQCLKTHLFIQNF